MAQSRRPVRPRISARGTGQTTDSADNSGTAVDQDGNGVASWGPQGVPSATATGDPVTASIAPVVVVGLGNDIACDDGVGLRVAGILEEHYRAHPEIDVVALPWAGFALLDVLRGRRRAALIDCLVSGVRPPGSIVRLSADDYAGSVRLNSFHDISYPTAMDLGRRLGWEMPSDVAIWAIEASVTERFGERLSREVGDAADEVVDLVRQYVDDELRLMGAAT